MAIMATLFVSGCVKETIQSGVTILTAGIETKTVLQNDEAVLWTNGDKVNVNGVESAALELAEPSTSASFTFNAVLNQPYCAVFPASIYKNAATVTLPATQEYVAGTFAQNASPMAAYTTEGDNLRFQHLCAVLKLTVTKPAESTHNDIAYVEFYGKNGEQVCGDFTIDFETMTLIGASAADADKKLTYNVSSEFVDGALTLYVVVPAAEYSNGYTVKIADAQGHYMEQSKKSAQTLVAGGIYEMPAFDFVPSSTQLDVEISSAAELISFISDYNAGQTPAVAVIKNDFAFSDEENAAFQSINSLTTVIDGNNCTISNFNSGKPLAVNALTGSSIKNLTIDGNATISATSKDMNVGTFVGASQAVMTNCHNKVNYVIASNHSEGYLAVGGLIGRLASGEIVGCSSCGNIEFASSFSSVGENTIYIGGLVGRNSNESGKTENSTMNGTLKFLGTAEYNVYLGGIAGHANGTIKDCEVLSAGENQAVSGEYKGTILIDTDAAKYIYAAGVLGYGSETSKVEGCENKAEVCANLIRNANDECRRVRLAGVAAHTDGQVDLTDNNATVSLYSSVKTQWLSGLVCSVGENAKISNSSNKGAIVLGDAGDAEKGGRENYVGGLVAQCSTSSVEALTNDGSVTIEMIDYDNTNSYLYVGGCFGIVEAAVAGGSKIVNNAGVTWNSTEGWAPKGNAQFAIGGAVGIAKASISGLNNNGEVLVTESNTKTGAYLSLGGVIGVTSTAKELTISDCINAGKVNFKVSGATRSYSGIYIGGVLGQNPSSVTLTMDNCKNSAYILGGLPTSNNASSKYIGGIIGYLLGGSTMTNCEMTGRVYNDDWNNESSDVSKAASTGALVGRTLGLETAWILIKDCTVNMSDSNPLKARRGWIGGVTGYAKWAHMENCDLTFKNEGSYYVYGGIAGQMVAATAKNCTVNASCTSSQTKYAGGLVGRINGASWIDGCTFRGDVGSTKSGAALGILAGQGSAAGAQIMNCKYKATVSGAASTVLVGANPDNVTLTNNTELSE